MSQDTDILILRTTNQSKQTLGRLLYKNFSCFTLELPWKDNKTEISCIPAGKYKVSRRYSSKYGDHLQVLDVKDRTYILIHSGNYYSDILGCILVGSSLVDLNKDGYKDVTESKNTLKKLLSILPKTNITLEIRYELVIPM